MNKTIKVEFIEQSKCVTAQVKVEYIDPSATEQGQLLEEAKQLFNEAQKFAIAKSMQKM